MKPGQSVQVEFIKTALRSGGKRETILSKFVQKWQNTSSRTFDRRLREAEKALQAEQSKIQDKSELRVAKEIEEREQAILTAVERQELLSKIATGEIEIPTKKPQWDNAQKKFVFIPIIELPNHNDRIKAIAELNKMGGNYAPNKIDLITSGKQIKTISIEPIGKGKG